MILLQSMIGIEQIITLTHAITENGRGAYLGS